MKRIIGALLPLATIGAQGGGESAPHEVTGDGRALITIDGQAVPARLGPGYPSFFYLPRARADALFGADAVIRKPGFSLFSVGPATGARIGPVDIRGRARRVPLSFDGAPPEPAWVKWFETDVYPGAEALGGPYAVPAPVVRFTLRPAVGDEGEGTLPLAERMVWWLASVTVPIDGHDVHFAFAPQFPRTVASAAAGAAMGRAYGARFDGAALPVLISHEVRRPARPVMLLHPLVLGPLSLTHLLVRTHDYGAATNIDPSEADGAEEPKGDVVVSGKRNRTKPSYVVYIGADLLDRCASITYDKIAMRVTLRCRPAAS